LGSERHMVEVDDDDNDDLALIESAAPGAMNTEV
jgi:hypothetical protein